MTPIVMIGLGVFVFLIFILSFVTVQQGMVGVTTIFGKYRRVLTPGLNLKIPFLKIFTGVFRFKIVLRN